MTRHLLRDDDLSPAEQAEILDLAVYARQWQIEREVMIGVLREVAAAETEAERIHVTATAQALLESLGASSG